MFLSKTAWYDKYAAIKANAYNVFVSEQEKNNDMSYVEVKEAIIASLGVRLSEKEWKICREYLVEKGLIIE